MPLEKRWMWLLFFIRPDKHGITLFSFEVSFVYTPENDTVMRFAFVAFGFGLCFNLGKVRPNRFYPYFNS